MSQRMPRATRRSGRTSTAPYRMPSAVDFLPPIISELVNFATSLSLYFGSGVILRFGTSLRRGIAISSQYSAYCLGRFTPYFERLRLRVALLVLLGPAAPDASSVPRTTW